MDLTQARSRDTAFLPVLRPMLSFKSEINRNTCIPVVYIMCVSKRAKRSAEHKCVFTDSCLYWDCLTGTLDLQLLHLKIWWMIYEMCRIKNIFTLCHVTNTSSSEFYWDFIRWSKTIVEKWKEKETQLVFFLQIYKVWHLYSNWAVLYILRLKCLLNSLRLLWECVWSCIFQSVPQFWTGFWPGLWLDQS